MKEVFELKEPSCSLRSLGNYFVRGYVKTTHYGIQSIKYLAPKIWNLVPYQIKHSTSLTKFKNLSCLGHQVTVLVGYAKNILRKQASFD